MLYEIRKLTADAVRKTKRHHVRIHDAFFPIVALHKPAGYDQLFLRLTLFSSRSDIISIKGNAQPASIPFCISSPALWVIFPTIAGPSAPPRSPAMARSANIAVPPVGIFPEQMLIEPGHMIPTENPHIMQPRSPITGIPDRDAVM